MIHWKEHMRMQLIPGPPIGAGMRLQCHMQFFNNELPESVNTNV